MIYVIKGQEPYLVRKKIDEIISQNEDAQLTRFNGSDKTFNVTVMLDACTSVGLFADKTLVLVRDPSFLCEKVSDKDAGLISDYCSNPLYENTLVLYTFDDSFNERLKTYKDVAANAQVIRYDQLKNKEFYNACIDILKQRKLRFNSEITRTLVKSANNNLTVFDQNLDVLCLYPDEITPEAVNSLLTIADFDDVFALINALTAKKISLSMNLANRLLANNNSVIGLTVLLGNQLRFLYEVSYYNKQNDSVEEIMDRTGTKSRYRIEKALENLAYLKDSEIIELLDRLADLNFSLVTENDIDQKLQFELFITALIGERNG